MSPQIKDGTRYAFGHSAAEFKDVMKVFSEEAAKVLEAEFAGNQEMIHMLQPIFSFDNDHCHNGADDIVGPQGTEYRAPLPPYSPDMHKVIEHSYHYLSQKMRGPLFRALWKENNEHHFSPTFWWKVVEDYYKKYKVEFIRKDIESLDDTYEWIIENGGLRAPNPYN